LHFLDASGFELCGRLRDGEPGRRWNRDVPVIMVSARGDPVDRVRGFARGCDDYVVKPFVYDELLARMRAVLRRSNGPRHPRLSVRDLEIDLASRVVTLAGEAVQLSAKEYELLVALAEDPERVFKKEELLRNVWGFRSLGSRLHSNPIHSFRAQSLPRPIAKRRQVLPQRGTGSASRGGQQPEGVRVRIFRTFSHLPHTPKWLVCRENATKRRSLFLGSVTHVVPFGTAG
jgi:DNA-binding response OmpR family regulator